MGVKATVYCPECEGILDLNNPRMRQRIKCPRCGTELEVVWLNPVDVDYIYDDEDEDD
jgi:lysine biosynthesis protein LysW